MMWHVAQWVLVMRQLERCGAVKVSEQCSEPEVYNAVKQGLHV